MFSMHVDLGNLLPRCPECGKGNLLPVRIEPNSEKGILLAWKCSSCGRMVNP